jgi:hypothetical protein
VLLLKFLLSGVGTLTVVPCKALPLLLPLIISHLLALVVNHYSAIHKLLEIGVGGCHELELQSIMKSLEEKTLLVLVISNIIRSIP